MRQDIGELRDRTGKLEGTVSTFIQSQGKGRSRLNNGQRGARRRKRHPNRAAAERTAGGYASVRGRRPAPNFANRTNVDAGQPRSRVSEIANKRGGYWVFRRAGVSRSEQK